CNISAKLSAPTEGVHRLANVLHDLRPVKWQPLPPRIHEHDLADLALALETSPHRACRGVVLFLLRKRTTHPHADVVHRWEFAVRALPDLPPVALEDAAFVGHRHLLQASARKVRAEFSFDARDFPRAKPLRPHQRAFALLDLGLF